MVKLKSVNGSIYIRKSLYFKAEHYKNMIQWFERVAIKKNTTFNLLVRELMCEAYRRHFLENDWVDEDDIE